MKTTKEITDKIYEILPYLKELSFGCEIDVDIPHEEGYDTVVWKSYGDFVKTTNEDTLHEEEFKIIGHPITPIDIIKCLNKNKKVVDGEMRFYLFDGSIIWSYPVSSKNGEFKIETEYQDKPFSEQSEKTQQFIGNVIL